MRSVGAKEEGQGAPYVEHTVKAGESISKLAQMYYGDYKLFHVIAQYNGMDDATQVAGGDKIKIPRLAGLPFHTPGAAQHEPGELPDALLPAPPLTEDAVTDIAEAPAQPSSSGDEQVAAYREAGIELFQAGKYEDAIFELNKAIEASPHDQQTRLFLAQAYFESGKQLFEHQDYKAAEEAFESSRQYNPKCEQCAAYIDKSRLGPLLLHRSRGLTHFNNEAFPAAIVEFEQYLQERPNDMEARTYLSKAYFHQALIDYEKGDFLTARKGFTSALAYDSGCLDCNAYIERSIRNHKEAHYNKGIVYFSKEQLTEAIAEWEMVYELDPGYKEVEQNLKRARALLEKLERIKESSQ